MVMRCAGDLFMGENQFVMEFWAVLGDRKLLLQRWQKLSMNSLARPRELRMNLPSLPDSFHFS